MGSAHRTRAGGARVPDVATIEAPPMRARERRVWYVLALVALGVALYVGMKYPELHDNVRPGTQHPYVVGK